MQALASKVGAPFYTVNDVVAPALRRYSPSSKDLSVDDLNADIAHAAILLLQRNPPNSSKRKTPFVFTQSAINDGLSARPTCRFEVVQLHAPGPCSTSQSFKSTAEGVAILDIAHNPDAMAALATRIRSVYPTDTLRWGFISIEYSNYFYVQMICRMLLE